MTDLDRLVAVQTVKEGSILGRLCWYTVPEDIWVSRGELVKQFRETGLKEKWLPNPIRPSDAFRRASARIQAKNIEIEKDKLYANILVREVTTNRKEIERHVIWETVDADQKRLSYRQVAKLRLDKDTNTVSAITELAAPEQVEFECSRFAEVYNYCLSHYDGNGIRKCVSQVISCLMATAVRPSGAVYFVPEKYATDLAALGKVIKSLEAEYFEVPLMDAVDARDMVIRKFIHQTTSMIESLAEVLKDPKVTKGKCLTALEQSKRLTEQVNEYKSFLQVNLTELEERIRLLSLQALSLVDKAQELTTNEASEDPAAS